MSYIPFKKPLVILVIIAAIPVTSYLIWFFKSEKPIEIFIINKTVSSLSRIENKSVFWALNYNKFVRKKGQMYDYINDYYGFFPLKPHDDKDYKIKDISINDIDSLSDHYDMAWFVDTYGLSFGDWYGYSNSDQFSRMLYGGLNQNDYMFIKEMLNKNKLVIAEFNLFASPTSYLLRSKIEKMLNIYWSGWTGMYYDNLDYTLNQDVPAWIVDQYRKQNEREWMYTKPGIILVNDNSSVIVLENETHIDIEAPLVITSDYMAERYGVTTEVHYPHRFDISFAADTTNVISHYELSVNSNGERLLKKHNIPSRFPAVTVNVDNGLFYYLAGSFSDYELSIISSCFQGAGELDYFLNKNRTDSKSDFFWTYYYPLVSNVILEYYNSLESRY